MTTSILNFTLVNSPKTKFSDEQVLLQEFTGQQLSRNNAETVWENVLNHKWNMSERLGRDVGFKVAATDYFENFYQTNIEKMQTEKTAVREIKIPQFIQKFVRFYFEAKGTAIYF
ncbi:MAG: DUF4032 domain-containing protein [Pyrinomonadaceae bacterium]|nr:DUF4032 domain-containing protein [Pyrinomonadaceae bacterium]